jgi:membrane protein implicated in regulation of membrane protease activity
MSVRVSPISRTAAFLIIAVGAFVLLAGLVTGSLADDIAGVAFVTLGTILNVLLLRFTRKLRNQINEATKG